LPCSGGFQREIPENPVFHAASVVRACWMIDFHVALAAAVQYALRHPGHFRAMFHIELQAQGDFPALKEAGTRAFDSLLNLVAEGIARRELINRPARGLATVAWAAVHGASLLLLDGQIDSPPEPNDVVKLVIERLDAGLARP
jgi:hypothetical protein